jgi:Asp-tRNA(Asn)/Glu-tRNA(Gln) amidotransferase A subunit family amidase
VGLRPTFGRVPRSGAMALCWSLDKLGPIPRGVEDTALVLGAINAPDPRDPGSSDIPLAFDGRASAEGAVIGYDPAWFETPAGTGADRAALRALKRAGCRLKKIKLPDLPYDSLETILFAEAAAAFEDQTLTGRDRELPEQKDISWPHEFRQARFISAVDLIQAQRLRRKVMEAMADVMEKVDALIAPPEGTPLLTITNCTGHPALAVPTGFAPRANDSYKPSAHPSATTKDLPHCTVLWGRLYDDGRLVEFGMALERELGLGVLRPPLFS